MKITAKLISKLLSHCTECRVSFVSMTVRDNGHADVTVTYEASSASDKWHVGDDMEALLTEGDPVDLSDVLEPVSAWRWEYDYLRADDTVTIRLWADDETLTYAEGEW